MTKLIISLFFLLIFLTETNAQVDNVTGQYVDKGNILLSPGAESGLKGWTNSAGTFTVESTGAIVGQRVFKVVLSSQTLNLRQDSAKYATEYADGIQLLGYARVKTSVSGVKLCPRKAEVTQTSLCVSHTGSGKWELLKVPFISSGISNGLALITDTAKSGTIYVDDAFVGAVDLSATQSFDTTCDTVACQTEFSIKVSGGGATIFETNDWASSTRNATGNYVINFNSGVFSVSPSCQVSTSEAGNYVDSQIDSLSPTAIAVIVKDSATTTFRDKQFEVFCQKQGADYAAAIAAQKAFQKSKVSSYSSTNADTDWQACKFSTLAWQGLGTVTNNLECKRQGSDLLMRGTITLGTVSNLEARIPLPTWNGIQLLNSKTGYYGNFTTTNATLNRPKNFTTFSVSSGLNYMNVGIAEYAIGSGGAAALLGNTYFSNNDLLIPLGQIRIPIQFWENSNVIIGQFNGLESCTDSYQCTDTFSAKVSSAGVVSEENIDWINGNASIASTSIYALTFRSGLFTVAPNCTVSVVSTTGAINAMVGNATSTTVEFRTVNPSNNINVANSFNIICQKQGPDFVSKTAKAVASDQNVRSIGAVGVDIQSVYFGSGANCLNPCNTVGSCSICTRVGTKITSVDAVNTTGFYRLQGIDGAKYICNGQGLGSSSSGVITHELGSSTSTYAGIQAWNAGSGAAQGRASVTCIGVP